MAGAAATAVGAVDDFLRAAHQRLQGTRGAATTIARIDPTASSLEIAGAGNVQGVLVPPRARGVRRFASTPFVLGSAGMRAPTFRVERTSRVRGDTIILYTDGISSRADVAAEATAFGEHPVAIAERIARSHSRAGDDVLVIVAR